MAERLDEVRRIIDDAGYGLLATCDDGQPRVRPMSFVLMDDGRLWSSTYDVSGKMREFDENARVEVCFVARNKVHLRISGTIDTSGGPAEKRRLLELNPRVGRHFADENDPKYVHLEIVPTRIRWKPLGFSEYREVET